MSESLYERLGRTEGITKIASDLVDLHVSNPVIAPRFTDSCREVLKKGASAFFIAGTGGPQLYEGKDMLETHRGMNISEREFIATLDDVLKTLEKNNVAQREQEEVLFVLYGMKSDIVFV
ncbi:group I truncated hemoglobin [Sessilibacter corallicola]|uniref:Group 1 truncated hemoglobin n=1 Tax=Sessilibacter corallicola TaxID=2904075 RepID=A0ABQ0AFB4_9GAMM